MQRGFWKEHDKVVTLKRELKQYQKTISWNHQHNYNQFVTTCFLVFFINIYNNIKNSKVKVNAKGFVVSMINNIGSHIVIYIVY